MALPKNMIVTDADTRCSYLNVNQPRAFGTEKPRYSVSVIIPKSKTNEVNKIKAAIKQAYEDGANTLKGKGSTLPPLESIDNPLRDGDAKGDPAYADSYYINAKNTRKPGVVDTNRNPIIQTDELYSGIYARVAISFFAYNKAGHKGIGASLLYLMKTADGEPLGSTVSIDDVFGSDSSDDDFLA